MRDETKAMLRSLKSEAQALDEQAQQAEASSLRLISIIEQHAPSMLKAAHHDDPVRAHEEIFMTRLFCEITGLRSQMARTAWLQTKIMAETRDALAALVAEVPSSQSTTPGVG